MENISKIIIVLLVCIVMVGGCADINKTSKDVFSAITFGVFDESKQKDDAKLPVTGA